MRGLVIPLACAAVAMSSVAFAASHRGSMEDQIACTPDVYRLCSNFVPDEDAIVACLKRNKAALSSACGRVFSQPNPGSTQDGQDD